MSNCNNIGVFSTCHLLIAIVCVLTTSLYYLFVIVKRTFLSNKSKYLCLLLLFCVLSGTKLFAQNISDNEAYYYSADNLLSNKDDGKDDDDKGDKKKKKSKKPSLVYDEIPVLLTVVGYGNFDLDIIFTDNGLLYVNVEDLFRILMISCNMEPEDEKLFGYFLNEENTYSINYKTKEIQIGEKTFACEDELVKEMGILYLESSLLSEVFGIELIFNYRSLLLILKSHFELPLIKQQRLEKMRKNLSKIKGEFIVDTIIKRNYHLFKPGMLDWSISSTQSSNNSTISKFGLGLGSELLFGEATVSANYDSKLGFDDRYFHYLWRWVDNEKKIIKQAQIGKISNQSIAFYNSPIIGTVIRNTPTNIRKAKGYYTINDFTEPNWTVELYINDVMVDYTKADASGMYFFEVPNVYGFTTLKLKFYGPLGEERIEESTVNIPYTFMPEKEFEYSITSGIIQDSSLSRYGKGEINYGLNRIVTIGGGLEYLSSISNNPYIPFVKTSIQPFSKLTLIGEYAHNVRTVGLLNYNFHKNASLIIDYTNNVKGQKVTQFNYLEERKIILSIPYRYKKISGFSKIDFTQYIYETFKYNSTNYIFSAYYKQFSANSTTQINWIEKRQAFVIATNSFSWRLKGDVVLRPSFIYDYMKNTVMSYKFEAEKKKGRSCFTISYERNRSFNNHIVSVGFKCDLSFARTNITAIHSENVNIISGNAQGSITFGSGNNQIIANKNSSVGKGGISLYPFLDLNNNGIFDKGEKMVKLNSVKVHGGKVIFSKKDSIIRIPNLNAFISYNVEFNDNDLDNIAWRFNNKIYSILVDPYQYKRVDIPIISVGEVLGMAYMKNKNSIKGIGRITVEFYKKDSDELIAKTLSESDGYINYLGFAPGEYVARIDSLQLSKLDFVSEPSQINFTIKELEDGDIIESIEFVLSKKDAYNEIEKKSIINSINKQTDENNN